VGDAIGARFAVTAEQRFRAWARRDVPSGDDGWFTTRSLLHSL
jgi:hypothetical protein